MKGKIVIIGAGIAGRLLIENIRREDVHWNIVGFVDDAEDQGRDLPMPIIGAVDDLPELIDQMDINQVIIAAPSQHGQFVRRIVLLLAECPAVGIWVIPRMPEIVFNAKVSYADVRPIEPRDIIGEMIIKSEQLGLADTFAGKTVLVTGGAGSIGSELSKQIFLLKPKKLIVVDAAESSLFHTGNALDHLSTLNDATETEYVLGTIHNEALMRRLFGDNAVDMVFHAAAYKHVPIVEENVYEGAKNNVAGTYAVARMAGECGCKRFVLISTDKAARPANVMGMTKYVAEHVVRACQSRFPDTTYATVRFGNVFNSSGSAVEVFLDQLRRGKVVTITDPEMTRYFMTIPEAVHLVLQASFMDRDHAYVLDMGTPIGIMEIARCLARISGHAVSGIEFRIVGSRPGEKKHEILFDDEAEESMPTRHPRIARIRQKNEGAIDAWQAEMEELLAMLERPDARSHSEAGKAMLREKLERMASSQARKTEPQT